MFRGHFVPNVLLSGLLALSVSMPALATYTITGDTTLTDNATYSNNTGNGIQTTDNGTYNVGVDGALNVNNNTWQGISVFTNSNVTFTGVSDTAAFNISNSGERGMYVNSGANLTLANMDVSITGSKQRDIYGAICNHGVLTVNGNGSNNFNVTGNSTRAGLHMLRDSISPVSNFTNVNVNISNNDQYGIWMESRNGETNTLNVSSTNGNNNLVINNNQYDGIWALNSQLNFSGMNIEILNNGFGAQAGNGAAVNDDGIDLDGKLTVTGSSQGNNMNVSNNAMHGVFISAATNGIQSGLSAQDMNITLNGNGGYGLYLDGVPGTIESTNNNNTLTLSNNKLDGILVRNGQLTITGMNINVLSNGSGSTGEGMAGDGGIEVLGKLTITGDGNNMDISNNKAYGLSVKADTSGAQSGLLIRDMNGTFNGNGAVGLYTEVAGTIESTSGSKNLIASNNGADGMNFQGDMTITNMNIQTNSNGGTNTTYDGIENTAKLTIAGNGSTVLQATGNGGAGITSYTSNAALNISDMNIDLSDNEYGMVVGSSGATISSTSGENVLSVTGNKSYGVNVSGSGTSLTLENMDAELKNNGNIALNASGTTLNISSASGNNKMVFDNNTDNSFYAVNTNTTIDKMNIYISNTTSSNSTAIGMSTHGVFEMTGNGSNVLSIETSDRGLHIANSDTDSHYATIKDYNLNFANNTAYGIWVNDSVGTISSTNKNNQMYFAGNGKSIYLQSEGNTNATNTDLNINGMQMVSNDAIFATVEGSASFSSTLNMQDSTLNLNGSNQIVYDLNKGVLTLSNVTQTGAAPTTLIQNTGTSSFGASNNSFIVGKITDNGQLTGSLNSGSTWKMLDNSNTYALNVDNATVDMRSQTSGEYNTLTIGNSLSGTNNATVYMNTNLDEPQSTDQIVLLTGGRTTGTTNLNITNTAAASSYGTFIKGDGIKVVDAQGSAVTGASAFDLVGKRIDTGLYIQELYYQNLGTSDESWYIRTATEDNGGGNQGSDGSYSNGNKPKPTDLTNTVASMPAVALSVVKTINSELRNRLGELRSNNPKAHNGLWARGYYKSLEVDEKIKNEMDIYGFEAGYDHLISQDRMNRTYLGIMAGYAWADKVKVHQTNGYKGKGDTTVPSVGAYLTWINKNGWYTDTVIRGFYTQMDVTNYSAQGLPITYDADNWAVAGSFEFGRRTALYQNGRNGFVVEPKAQVVYTYMPGADHKTSLGQKIKYDDTQSLVTRAAIMAAYRRTFANGMALEPYVQVGVAYEWLGKTDVNFIGSDFTSDVKGATFEGVLGINARLSRGWHMYGDFTVEKGSVYDSWGGHLGVRYNF